MKKVSVMRTCVCLCVYVCMCGQLVSLFHEYENSPVLTPVSRTEVDASGEPMTEPITENPTHVNDIFLSKHKTYTSTEDKYLELAPGTNKQSSFASIRRACRRALKPVDLFEWTTQIYDRTRHMPCMMRSAVPRGVKSEHVLYVMMKVMRMRLTESTCCTFKRYRRLKLSYL